MTYITTNDDYAEDFILVTYKQLCELINEFILITLLDLPFCKKKKNLYIELTHLLFMSNFTVICQMFACIHRGK